MTSECHLSGIIASGFVWSGPTEAQPDKIEMVTTAKTVCIDNCIFIVIQRNGDDAQPELILSLCPPPVCPFLIFLYNIDDPIRDRRDLFYILNTHETENSSAL
jgi:hypothetical protein